MDQRTIQRRRAALAILITLVAVPIAFSFRDSDSTTLARPSALSVTTLATEHDPLGDTPPAYLEGDVSAPAKEGATIKIPLPVEVNTGTASYLKSVASARSCRVKDAPLNARVSITNLSNSRSISCVASYASAEQPDDVLLHRDAFAEIADLTDAPIMVEYTW